jgi:Zn-dependent protease with chaperone function
MTAEMMRRTGIACGVWWLLAALLCMLPQSASARFVPPQPCKNAYTPDQEVELGHRAKAHIYDSAPVFSDTSVVSQYVSDLGMRLTKFAPGAAWPYEFHVIDEADINAFALPGGAIFVNLGTVQAAETEAQLAGVLAHEISHVAMRHSTCNITKQRRQRIWWALAEAGAGMAVPGIGGAASAVGLSALEGQLGLKMSRDDERQADLMGVDLLHDAGYDPRALPQFFEVIAGHYGPGGKQWLSDHPNPGNRTEYVNDEIETLPVEPHPLRTSDTFTALKQRIDGIHAYTAKEISSDKWRKQPLPEISAIDMTPPGTMPNGRWQDLEDTGFSLRYPENWQVYDGPGTAVTIAPKSGLAPELDGEKSVICGVLSDVYQPRKGSDLASATEQLIAYLQQGNAGLQSTGAVGDTTLAERAAKTVELKNLHAPEAAEHDWLVTALRRDGSLEYVVFVAPEAEFESLRLAFQQVFESFRLRE